jgi:threonyl-tRNA synthetase
MFDRMYEELIENTQRASMVSYKIRQAKISKVMYATIYGKCEAHSGKSVCRKIRKQKQVFGANEFAEKVKDENT